MSMIEKGLSTEGPAQLTELAESFRMKRIPYPILIVT